MRYLCRIWRETNEKEYRRFIPLSSAVLAFSRGLLGSVFLFVIMLAKGRKSQKPNAKKLFLLAVTGAIMGLNWMLLFEAYNYTSVAIATMCYYMQPTIVILLSPLVFRERLTFKKMLCALTAIIGMVFISGVLTGTGVQIHDIKGILFGIGAALLYSAVVILNKKVVLENVYEKSVIQLASAAIILIPYLLITENLSEIDPSGAVIGMVLLVGAVLIIGSALVSEMKGK